MHYSQGLNLISIDSQCGSFLCKELLCVWIIICQRHSGVWRWVLTSVEVDLFRLNGYESYYKFTREKTIDISPHVRKSKTVLDFGFHAVDSGFWSLVGFRIPWAVSLVPQTKLSRVPDSTSKNFTESGIRIPYRGQTYAVSGVAWNITHCPIGQLSWRHRQNLRPFVF